jgi:hypothetical protein
MKWCHKDASANMSPRSSPRVSVSSRGLIRFFESMFMMMLTIEDHPVIVVRDTRAALALRYQTLDSQTAGGDGAWPKFGASLRRTGMLNAGLCAWDVYYSSSPRLYV